MHSIFSLVSVMHWNSLQANKKYYFLSKTQRSALSLVRKKRKKKRCWPLLNAHRLSSQMIKGISGWESCNLWRSVMIWLWLLSGGAKGNHLLQHDSEIKGAADGFLTEREKWTDSSRSGPRCDDGAGVRIIKRGPGVTKQRQCMRGWRCASTWKAISRPFGLCVCLCVWVFFPPLWLLPHAVLLQAKVQLLGDFPHIYLCVTARHSS